MTEEASDAGALDERASGFPQPTARLFALACGLAVASVFYAQPLLGAMAEEFAIPKASIGGVYTLTQIGYAAGLTLLVPLGDLVERRGLALIKLALSALALFAIALAPSREALLLGAGALGVCAVVTQTLVAYAAGLAQPHERGRVVGAIVSGGIFGIVFARTAGPVLSEFLNWRAIYLVAGATTLAVAAKLSLVMPRTPANAAAASYVRLIGSMFALFAQEPLLRSRAMIALLSFAAATALWTPMALQLASAPFNLSPALIGLFGLAGAAGALGAAHAGAMTDRGLAQRTTGVGLAVMLAAWALTAALHVSVWALALGAALMDFGLQAAHVSSQGLIMPLRPEARSRLVAAYMIFWAAGCGAGAIASTLVYAAAGWAGVSVLGAAISGAALVFWMLARRREKNALSRAASR